MPCQSIVYSETKKTLFDSIAVQIENEEIATKHCGAVHGDPRQMELATPRVPHTAH